MVGQRVKIIVHEGGGDVRRGVVGVSGFSHFHLSHVELLGCDRYTFTMGDSHVGFTIRSTFLAGAAFGTAAGVAACVLALRKVPKLQERIFGPTTAVQSDTTEAVCGSLFNVMTENLFDATY